jgi:hypothetical protein
MSVMKIQLSFRIILTGVLIGLLSACATYPSSGPAALVGTWTNSLGAVWTIKADNTFDVVVAKHHLWGNLAVAGDTVTIQETGGKPAKLCSGPGVYKFARTSQDTLAFTLVKDHCKDRIKNVTLTQHLK